MTTVVVTGASGFLGRVLVARLVGAGIGVTAVSRRPVLGAVQVSSYGETPAGDLLVHLAEDSDRSRTNARDDDAVRRSSAVATSLVRQFRGRVIYASSAVVYGDDEDAPHGVHSPVVAGDAYSRLKLANERIVLDAGGTVCRLSNLIGVGMAQTSVVVDIVSQIPGRGPVRVRDDTPVRDFLAVEDAADAFALLAADSQAGIWNVGSGVGTSVRSLALQALTCAGEETREIVATQPSMRRSITILDISRTTQALNWTPRVALIRQLARIISHRNRSE